MSEEIFFELSAFEDFQNWAILDREIYRKIINLIKELKHSSLNIPEQATRLKRELNGYWSIKINEEHRLVYKVTSQRIIIVACKYHYLS